MGIYINNKVILQKEKEREDELTKANMMLQLADKETKLQNLQNENATIMLEIAMIKGGM